MAYRFGKPVSIDYLISFLPDTNGDFQHVTGLLQKSTMSLEEAKAKYPEWYDRRIVQGDKRGRWTVKRDLYDWWLHRIESEITVGHRFYGIMTLAIYAVKCRIDEDELRRDAYRLLEVFDGLSYEDSNRFTKDDVVKALEMYNESYVTFPRNDIAKYSGIPIPANKRNWRKQDAHIQYMNLQRAFKVSMGESTNGGRPTVQQTVLEWRKKHPDERKSACIQATGLSKNSVYKWWYTYDEYLQQMKSSPSFSDLLMGKTK